MITEITTARRGNVITFQACMTLGMSLIYWPANQPAKPPFEGVLSSWRLDHETALNYRQGRALALPSKRVARWSKTKRLRHMAQLVARPHNQNRIHDGQDWSYLGHSLPTSQSGQE